MTRSETKRKTYRGDGGRSLIRNAKAGGWILWEESSKSFRSWDERGGSRAEIAEIAVIARDRESKILPLIPRITLIHADQHLSEDKRGSGASA
jgi:hypothetical protein